MKSYEKPRVFQKIANERIKILFKEAASMFPQDEKLAKRYVTLARKIASKYKVVMPDSLKKRHCKHCFSYFVPGKSVRIRTRPSQLVYTCLSCGKYMRFPYKGTRQISKRNRKV